MLILHRFQKLKASSECSLRTNPSSWKEFRSILKTLNFLHQQNAEAGQMASKMKEMSTKSKPFDQLMHSVDAKNSFFKKVSVISKKWLGKFLVWT